MFPSALPAVLDTVAPTNLLQKQVDVLFSSPRPGQVSRQARCRWEGKGRREQTQLGSISRGSGVKWWQHLLLQDDEQSDRPKHLPSQTPNQPLAQG